MKADSKLEGHAAPEGLNRAEVDRILEGVSETIDLPQRAEQISGYFLGMRYVEGSLGGGPDVPEALRISLDEFDCVTYIETVLAMALSATDEEFIDAIRRIRYEAGEIDWFHRNHYMINWARNNEKGGFIANITNGPDTAEKTCTLGLVAGIPAKAATFRFFPKTSFCEVETIAETGDLIFFVATKVTLDVFHTGLLLRGNRCLLLRHATRTAGAVIEQELIEFINDNEMAGFILLRPLCQP